jgi:proline iminopeptidase
MDAVPTLDVNGATIWYDVVGTGPLGLVLHGGLGFDHALYQATLTPLEQRLRLVYVDHRGNGRSGRPPLDTITIEQLADDAAALARQLSDERVVLIGHSYGGFVAQEVVLRHPDLAAAVILVDTTPGQLGATEDRDHEQGPAPPPEVVALMTTLPSTNEDMVDGVRQLMPYYLHRRDPSELDSILDATVFDAAAMARGFEVLAGWSSVDRLSSIVAPTLVLAGRHDVFTSWPQGRRIASRIPGAELVIFEDSGHMPWLDEPDRFFEVVDGWLAKVLG